MKARVRAHRYPGERMAVFHGPRRLADHEPDGSPMEAANRERPPMTARFRLFFMPLLPHPPGRHAPTGNAPTTRASAGAGPETDRR